MNPEAARHALTRQRDSLAAPRPLFEGPVADPVRPKPGPDGSFTHLVRETILDRDHRTCMRCGAGIDGPAGYSLQHRINRGAGGTSDPLIGRPSNGITLCGSATTGCHDWAEKHPLDAERAGYAVASWADPTSVPVLTYAGWLLLTDSGNAWAAMQPPDGDAHSVARRRASRGGP